MALVIELGPEAQERIERAAAAQGLTAPEYAKRVLLGTTPQEVAKPMGLSTEDRIQAFRQWIASHDKYAGRPPLPDEALDRESIYEGRGT